MMAPKNVSKRVSKASDTINEAPIKPTTHKRARSESTKSRSTISNDQIFYFAPSSSILSTLKAHFHLDEITTNLLSALIHQFQLAIYLTSTAEARNANPIDHEHPAGLYVDKHITKALSSHVNSDKLFPLRRTGESMKYILQELKSLNSRIDVFQILVWRVWAFGELDKLKDLNFAGGSMKNSSNSLVIAARALEFDIEEEGFRDAFLHKILTVFKSETFLNPKQVKFPRPVYGQLQLSKKDFEGMLASLWNISGKIFEGYQEEVLQSFEDVRNMFKKEKESGCYVNMVPSHGLLAWLIACDMWEFGLCGEPTVSCVFFFVLIVGRIFGGRVNANQHNLVRRFGEAHEWQDSWPYQGCLQSRSNCRRRSLKRSGRAQNSAPKDHGGL